MVAHGRPDAETMDVARGLLADEPTGNRDTKTASEVFELLRGFNARHGCVVLVVRRDDGRAAEVVSQPASWTSLNSLSDLLISQRRTSNFGLTSAGIRGSTKASRSARWNSRAMLILGPSA